MIVNINFFIFFWKRKGTEEEKMRKRLKYVRFQIGFGINCFIRHFALKIDIFIKSLKKIENKNCLSL